MSIEKDRAVGRRFVEPGELSARERVRDTYVRGPRRAPRLPVISRDPALRDVAVVDPQGTFGERPSPPPPVAPGPAAPAPVVLPPDVM
ncbi:hypothetical protein [Salinibacterium sp. ZJ70]|uniref:hypothetical protein n=1 Tax=Salinibacterium sp. ZJ70 TaxID=2708084 RepID=UPI00141F9A55|nr:hypothetical protein [Salinibacterium sp. ZJ70]